MRGRAFTLIELTLVAAIMLALLGLSMPLFKRTFADLSAKNAALNISKLIAYAQEKSIIDRKAYRMSFDLKLGSYRLLEPVMREGKASYAGISGPFGRAFMLPRGVYFYNPKSDNTVKNREENKMAVSFFPDGRSDELLLDIADKSGSGYRLSAKGFGSFVQIKGITRER